MDSLMELPPMPPMHPPPRPPSYITACLVMSAVTIAASVAVVTLRPGQDNLQALTIIVGFATTSLASILAFMKSDETHKVANSRFDEFKLYIRQAAEESVAKAHRIGLAEGEAAGRAAADARTDSLRAPAIPSQSTLAMPSHPPVPAPAPDALADESHTILLTEIAASTSETAENTAKKKVK